MTRYAQKTGVSSESSRGEIERTLRRYGATGFMYGWQEDRALIAFEMRERRVRFLLPMPDRNDPKFRFTPARRNLRTPAEQEREWEQACRAAWRALALVIKAKLEAVESGITVFEDEFLAHIMLPGGESVGEWMRPQVARAYQTGQMPPLLPAPETTR